MVKHICNGCDKIFDHKGSYDRHKNKKNPCIPPIKPPNINIVRSDTNDIFLHDICKKELQPNDTIISSHIISYNSHIIPDTNIEKATTSNITKINVSEVANIENNIIIPDCDKNKVILSQQYLTKQTNMPLVEQTSAQLIGQTGLHKCNYCGGIYSQACNLARHYKACQEKQKNDQKYQAEIDSLKQQNELLVKEIASHKAEIANNKVEIENYKADIKIKDSTISHLTIDYTDSKNKEVEYLKTVVNGAGGVIKTSFNALSYITTNYTKAPVMLPITDQSIITKNDDNFINEVVYSHTNDSLDTKIGDIIIAHYKKTDPKQQSLWTSDVSRLTYIMRTLINNKEDWFIDKKGNGLKTNIIDPILTDYIKPLLLTYIGNQQGLVANIKDGDKFEDIFNRMETANLIIKSINESILADNIIKYIASHFYCQKTDDNKLII